MTLNRTIKAALLGGLALALSAGFAATAEARVFVGVGFGFPLFGPWYYPPPYYYAPPAVYPAQPAYAAPQPQTWYYCESPRGYYPYVQHCGGGWRSVPATPPQGR
jgi:hypothetical protein